jgi:hypothetical protein
VTAGNRVEHWFERRVECRAEHRTPHPVPCRVECRAEYRILSTELRILSHTVFRNSAPDVRPRSARQPRNFTKRRLFRSSLNLQSVLTNTLSKNNPDCQISIQYVSRWHSITSRLGNRACVLILQKFLYFTWKLKIADTYVMRNC